jgi:hypothetical protein
MSDNQLGESRMHREANSQLVRAMADSQVRGSHPFSTSEAPANREIEIDEVLTHCNSQTNHQRCREQLGFSPLSFTDERFCVAAGFVFGRPSR